MCERCGGCGGVRCEWAVGGSGGWVEGGGERGGWVWEEVGRCVGEE